MSDKLLSSYGFLKQYRKKEKELERIEDDFQRKVLEAQLKVLKKKIIPQAYELERKIIELEKEKNELSRLRKGNVNNRGELRDRMREIDSEIINLTHMI